MSDFPSVQRIWHPWTSWECYRAGFFRPTSSREQLTQWRASYRELLSDLGAFRGAMERVLNEWPISAAHNLTNDGMNRVAWLGQSSCCITFGACAEQTRSAFNTLDQKAQDAANKAAADVLRDWLHLCRLWRAIA